MATLPTNDEKATIRLIEQAIASTIEVSGSAYEFCESIPSLT